MELAYHPLTPERWADFEILFGPRGAYGGCWCMWWRLRGKQFEQGQGEANRQAFHAIVEAGAPDGLAPGLLAYANGKAVGWCALARREIYPRLENSRVLARVDEQSVWSVTCFFVAKPYRRQGLTVGLLQATIRYVGEHGASILEGYPSEPRKGSSPDPYVYTGLISAFRKAGFMEVARRSETRPIMRYYI